MAKKKVPPSKAGKRDLIRNNYPSEGIERLGVRAGYRVDSDDWLTQAACQNPGWAQKCHHRCWHLNPLIPANRRRFTGPRPVEIPAKVGSGHEIFLIGILEPSQLAEIDVVVFRQSASQMRCFCNALSDFRVKELGVFVAGVARLQKPTGSSSEFWRIRLQGTLHDVGLGNLPISVFSR